MKIGIDARHFGSQDKGIGRHTQELILQLEKLPSNHDFFIFLSKKGFEKYQPQNSKFTKILVDIRPYSLKEQILFPKIIRNHDIDLMHFLHWNVPLLYTRPFIVTIHDLILDATPDLRKASTTLNPLFFAIKYVGYKLNTRITLKKALKIITLSHNSEKDIIHYYGISPQKIKIIPNGLTHFTQWQVLRGHTRDSVQGSAEERSKRYIINTASSTGGTDEEMRPCMPPYITDDNNLISRYNITKPFLLYVGASYPHKNMERAISAFQQVVKKQDIQFVCVGENDFFFQKLKYLVHRLNLDNTVFFTGFIPDADLSDLYQNATAFIFPSLYEGFGLTPLEAMAHGTPVISSNTSCLPEILGDAVSYFDPMNENDIARAILDIFSNNETRQSLMAKGYQQIKKYTWENAAKELMATYNHY